MINDNPSTLLFFHGSLPAGSESKPGFCASLEHLDTAFLLIGIERYPQAVVSCAAAVESLIVEAMPESKGADPPWLVRCAAVRWSLADQLCDGVLALKTEGDRIVLGGYSLEDGTGHGSVLAAGVQFLEAVYRLEYGFDLRRSLRHFVREHLRVAEELSKSLPRDANPTVAWHSFAHAVRWSASDTFMSPWDLEARDARQCGRLDWPLDLHPGGGFRLACPICGSDQECELDFEGQQDPVVWVDHMECKECGFWLCRASVMVGFRMDRCLSWGFLTPPSQRSRQSRRPPHDTTVFRSRDSVHFTR